MTGPNDSIGPSFRTRVLLTGMSGTGKSTTIRALRDLGHRAVDLDEPGWSEYRLWPDSPAPGEVPVREWLWREDRVRALLDGHVDGMLFVSGCAPNQARFRSAFDHVVLLTAPVALTVERLATRTNNDFGKDPAELAKVLADKREIEPLLARGATAQLETSVPVDEVVRALLALVTAPLRDKTI